jgi:hypothetical protein
LENSVSQERNQREENFYRKRESFLGSHVLHEQQEENEKEEN